MKRRIATSTNRSGFTLVETAISLALVGMLLVAALNTVRISTRTQNQSTDRTIAGSLADELMSEILRQAYREPSGGFSIGLDSGESQTTRSTLDDVDDYNGLSESPPKKSDGTSLPDLTNWSRSVSVQWVDPNSTLTTSATATGQKRITITVSHNAKPVLVRVALKGLAP